MAFYAVIFIGILSISLASILIKLCSAPAMVIASYRLGVASLFFVSTCLVKRTNPLAAFTRRDLLLAMGSGLFLSLHFAAWITSLKYTSVANSVVLMATMPIFVGLGSLLFLKERWTRHLSFGMVLTIAGAVTMSANKLGAGQSSAIGNALALCGAIAGAGYYLLGRDLRARVNTIEYVTVVYAITAVILILLTTSFRFNFTNYGLKVFVLFFLLALVPQVIGHTSFNWALRHVSAATVSVLTLGEPIGAPILAFFILGEKITAIQLIGGMLILIGVALALRGEFLKNG